MKSIHESIVQGLEKGKNLTTISKELGYSGGFVSNWLHTNGHNIDLTKYKIGFKTKQNTDKLYNTIKIHIQNNLSTTDIASKIKKSSPTVLKIIREKNEQEVLSMLIKNNNYSRSKGFRSTYGHNRGKTYEQIYGSKADTMKNKRRDWLRKNNIRKHAKRISKPQQMLYDIVKHSYPDAILDYRYKIADDKFIWLDIVVPSLKVNIEYDGRYWHQQNQKTIRVKDIERDKILNNDGWRVYRMEYTNNPTKEKLENDFKNLNF